MKKIVLVLVGGLLLGSCGTETTETNDSSNNTEQAESTDVIKNKLFELISDADKGMKPLMPISDVSKYDNNVKPYMVGEKETGNFNSKWNDGDFEGSRFYSKLYNDDTKLSEVRLSIMMKHDVYVDQDTGEADASKKIDFDKYLKLLSEKIGSEPEKETHTGGKHLWKTEDAEWRLGSYDDYSLEFTMKKVR